MDEVAVDDYFWVVVESHFLMTKWLDKIYGGSALNLKRLCRKIKRISPKKNKKTFTLLLRELFKSP